MGKKILTNGFAEVNSVDLSDHCHSITFGQGADAVELTAMGDTTHNFLPGLLNPSLTLEFFQDYAADSVDATLSAILTGGAAVTVEVRPDAGSRSASNPGYTGDWMLESYDAISGTVGQAAMSKATFKPAGAISRVVS